VIKTFSSRKVPGGFVRTENAAFPTWRHRGSWLLVVSFLLAGCAQTVPTPPASVRRGISELQTDEFLHSIPPGAHEVGTEFVLPPTWNGSGKFWRDPQANTEITYSGPASEVDAYFTSRAVELGLQPQGGHGSGISQGWSQTLRNGDVIQLYLAPGLTRTEKTLVPHYYQILAFESSPT
jgi:hypothetical protein